jgi:HEAT repeat protein
VAVREYYVAADPDCEAEFREVIARTIPSPNELLDDSYSDVRAKIIELFGKLANHGECQLKSCCGIADQEYEAEFHKAVTDMIPSFIKLFEDNNPLVRNQTVEVIGKLVKHGEYQLKYCCGIANQEYEAEFHEAVIGTVPSLIGLIEDKNWLFRSRAIEVIGKLANHGESQLENCRGVADRDYEAEFREGITSAVPLLIKRFNDEKRQVRREAVKIIGKLGNHGERQLNALART